MKIFAKDTETRLIVEGKLAPEMVCLTWQTPGEPAKIAHWTNAEPIIRGWLQDPEVLIVGQNVSYDMGVICAQFPSLTPLVFQAYEDDRVTDTMLRQKLLDIAAGCYRGRMGSDGVWHKHGYSLFDLARRLLGRTLKKDGWRMRYGEFRDIPIAGWPIHAEKLIEQARFEVAAFDKSAAGLKPKELKDLEKARYPEGNLKDLRAILLDPPRQVIEYPLDDARVTLDCFLKQEPAKAHLKSQFHEARAAWALHLSSCWGMRTSAEGVEQLRAITEEALVEVKARLVAAGMVREDGSRDTKAAAAQMIEICKQLDLPLRKTDKGGVCLDSDACLATESPLMLDYEQYTGLGKTLDSDYPMLLKGTRTPIQPHYDLAETSRTTCSRPNLQNVSKK